jgi:pyrroline-5-carboxylate reductase
MSNDGPHFTVAVLGAGSMGTTLARGLLGAGWPPQLLTLCVRRPEHASALEEEGFSATLDPTAAVSDADLIVLATKPKDISAVVASIQGDLRPDQTVLSVAAGVRIGAIEADLPQNPIVRSMPNTPSALGKGAAGYALGTHADESHEEQVRRVLGTVGIAVRVEESALNAVTAVSGSGPAYVFYLAEAMTAAGVELGLDPDVAADLANHTVFGAGAMLVAQEADAAELRRQVTSPGGTTAAAIEVMQAADLEGLIDQALRAARDRADEMG